MTLTPKNWKSFQHYKERTPSWIKLHKGLLTDFSFNRLPLASRALAPMLWLLASEYEDGTITASTEEIAFRLHVSVEELDAALSPLINAGFFIASEPLAKSELGACLEREDIGKRKEEKIQTAAKPQPRVNEDFENLKKSYPKRAGNYGWKAAERKFGSLVKTGVDPKIIIAAAVRLGETLRSRVGTEFIPMPASWLNSEDFLESAVVAFEDKPIDWNAICQTYKKLGIWSKHAPGNSPDSSSCLCPPEILTKHGIAVFSSSSSHDPPAIPALRAMQ